jgi:hypothetical protein
VVFGSGLLVGVAAGLLRRRPSPLSPEGAREPSSPGGEMDDTRSGPGDGERSAVDAGVSSGDGPKVGSAEPQSPPEGPKEDPGPTG